MSFATRSRFSTERGRHSIVGRLNCIAGIFILPAFLWCFRLALPARRNLVASMAHLPDQPETGETGGMRPVKFRLHLTAWRAGQAHNKTVTLSIYCIIAQTGSDLRKVAEVAQSPAYGRYSPGYGILPATCGRRRAGIGNVCG
jgi:hypothetical protein